MKKAQKWVTSCVMLSVAASMLLTTGCGTQQAPTRPKTGAFDLPGQGTSTNLGSNKPGAATESRTGVSTLDTKNAKGTNAHDLRVAQSIANAVQKVPGVQSAYVLYGGGIAYVTLNLTATGKPSTALTSNLKAQVTKIVKQQDRSINTVLVTADPDAFHHFQAYAKNVQSGHPIAGLVNQLFDIIHRVWPTQK